ncbi:MAG TPA: asparagine synthase-related protein [Desulfobaccales bacterium]|nr:asparagine synthase-related protein [Desulfobaccales bacterium]
MLGTFLISDLKRGLNYCNLGLPPGEEDACPPGFSQRLLWQDQHSHLSCTTREHYPVSSWETADLLVHLEGRIYHPEEPQLITQLSELAHLIFTAKIDPRTRLATWLLRTDGDFLLVLVNKADGGIAVINDVFGRLPTYVHLRDGCLILSRDLRRVTQAMGAADFDRIALAQYLLLGFPLGKRSWFAGIDYLEPASLVTISPADASIKVTKLYEFSLEGEEHHNQSPGENARNLASRFREACHLRGAGNGTRVISLSGGLDSRAVAAGLRREEIPFTAATFLNAQQSNAADVRVASQVAEALGVDWQLFRLRPPQGKDLVQLLELKSGANNLRMSHILPFFRQILNKFGPGITYFTGDGGGDALGVSCPYRRIGTHQALLDYVIDRYQVWPLDQVAALTRLAGQDIKAELAEHLASYPETALDRKYRHFFCLEVATKMYHEGEDRNRHFFWSATPFYSFDFFHYAMNCPDRDKQGYRLYREFLAQLHPAVGGIDYADWQAPLSSLKFSLLYQIKNLTRRRPNLIRRFRRLLGLYDRVDPDSNILGCLRDQSLAGAPLNQYLDPRSLARVLARPQDYDKNQLWTLLTLTSTLAYYICPRPRGDDFLERDFV